MIQLKPQVKLGNSPNRIQPEVFFAIGIAERIFESYGVSVTVAALLDGPTHHHYLGYEVDLEVPSDQAEDLATELQTVLLDSYVVRPEGSLIHVVFLNA